MPHLILRSVRRHPSLAFFVLTFGITWLFWVPVVLSSQGILPFQIPFFLFVLGGYGPTLAGIIMTGIKRGISGVRELLGPLLRWRVGIQWYIFVMFSTGVITLCVGLIYPLFSSTSVHLDVLGQLQSLVSVLPLIVFFGGPLSEELGWRGFALPKLQSRYNAFTASLIIGVMWGLWHLPAFWIAGAGQYNQPVFWFMVGAPAVAILYTWVYNHTNGSLLIAVLYHVAFDSTLYVVLPAFLTPDDLKMAFILAVGLLWVLAIAIVSIYGPQYLSRNAQIEDVAS